ncbi:MAG: GGDEF domain-containing protein [Campylobacterota bacterium]|nr:GGDEF domain-containing protein [Campylobacterota bacterium]
MTNESNTLLDKLVSLVSHDNVKEVTQIVESLNKINQFQHTIDGNDSLDKLFKKIAYELQVEFKIFNFSVILDTTEWQETLFTFGDSSSYTYTFHLRIDEKQLFYINISKENLTEMDKLSLNSYFDSIIQIAYLRYSIENSITTTIDPLTKLNTRMFFQEEAKMLIPLAIRENMKIGVLLINIDRFRAVNDEHGNEFGDDFLTLYATKIKEVIRTSDIAIRFGGGEFLVLLMNVGTEENTLNIAEKLKDILAQTYLLTKNRDKFKKTVCIGVSIFPDDSTDINEIVKNSEIALSDAQDQGRNKVLRFVNEQESTIDLF